MTDAHHESVILLIVPTPGLATTLAKRFEGIPGVRVMLERRRRWPNGERRKVLQPTDPERRSKQRRKSPRLRFEGTLTEAAQVEAWHLR